MIFGNPKVSILLTSYNNKMVKDAIDSVFTQTYKNWELIILDDNSNKKTQNIYKPYLKDPRVIYYNSKVKEKDRLKVCPYAKNINVGLKMATGKLIVYMCDDVVYLPSKLEKMVSFLKRHPRIKVCYNRQRMEIEGKRLKAFKKKNRVTPPSVIVLAPDRILRDPFHRVDHNSVMHYKSCINNVGDWETKSFSMADAYFWRKLGKKYPFYPIREILEVHHLHSESFSNKIANKKLNIKST